MQRPVTSDGHMARGRPTHHDAGFRCGDATSSPQLAHRDIEVRSVSADQMHQVIEPARQEHDLACRVKRQRELFKGDWIGRGLQTDVYQGLKCSSPLALVEDGCVAQNDPAALHPANALGYRVGAQPDRPPDVGKGRTTISHELPDNSVVDLFCCVCFHRASL